MHTSSPNAKKEIVEKPTRGLRMLMWEIFSYEMAVLLPENRPGHFIVTQLSSKNISGGNRALSLDILDAVNFLDIEKLNF